MGLFDDAEVIHTVTRRDLLASGDLVDVSEMGRQCGFAWPLAITAAVQRDLESIPAWGQGVQSHEGRLWDLCWMASMGLRRHQNLRLTPETVPLRIPFEVILSLSHDPNPEEAEAEPTPKTYDLVAEVDDEYRPVLTIAQHGED